MDQSVERPFCFTKAPQTLTPSGATVAIDSGAIALEVNGQTKQSSDEDTLIWNVRELIAELSLFHHLQPGDLIYTGSSDGVCAVVAGVAEVALKDGAAE